MRALEIIDLKRYPEKTEEVAKMIVNAWPELYQVESMFQTLKQDDYILKTLIATLNGKLIGTVSLVKHQLNMKHRTPWVAWLVIKEEHQYNGLGTKLLSKIITNAKEMGYQKLYLYTSGSGNFYKKNNWDLLMTIEDNKRIIEIYHKDISN